MKRMISAILAAALFLPLIGCGAAPVRKEEPSALLVRDLTAEQLHDALVEVAKAFYYKNPHMQYDNGLFTLESKSAGAPHRSTGQSPEDTGADTPHYSQCSEFCWDVYYEALGYKWLGGDHALYGNTIYKEPYTDAIVMSYDEKLGTHDDRDARIAELREKVEIGDIVFAYGKTASGEANTGHLMLAVGDPLNLGEMSFAHIWPIGSSLHTDMTTGEQKLEKRGGCAIQALTELLVYKSTPTDVPNYSLYDMRKGGDHFMLLRPHLMEECLRTPVPKATLTRLKYRGLELTKTADRFLYDDVLEGETIEITETVRNHSAEAYAGLTLTEYAPEGGELLSVSDGGKLENGAVSWTLEVPAGESVTVTYTVKNDLHRGETLVIPAGHADDLPTRTMAFPVGGARLTKSQNDALAKIASDGVPDCLAGDWEDLDFANRFYREILGAEIGLPATLDSLTEAFFQRKTMPDESMMLTAKTENVPAGLQAMLIPKNRMGYNVTTGVENNVRLMSILEDYYTPGDLVVGFYGKANKLKVAETDKAFIWIYLGSGKVLEHTGGGTEVKTFEETIWLGYRLNAFLGLRPTMGFDSIAAEVGLPAITVSKRKNVAQGADTSRSTYTFPANYGPKNLVDGNAASDVNTSTKLDFSEDGYVELDLGVPCLIDSYTVYNYKWAQQYAIVREWTLSGSVDGETWFELDRSTLPVKPESISKGSGYANCVSGDTVAITPVEVRYVRYHADSLYIGGSSDASPVIRLYELRIFGTPLS